MAFEVGERVTNSFTGPGTVQGPMVKDEDGTPTQLIAFDHAVMGTRPYPIKKLNSLIVEDPPFHKSPVIKKSASQIEFEKAQEEGLTYFETRDDIPTNSPDLKSAVFMWLGVELSSRGSKITIYATPKNKTRTAQEVAGLLEIPLEQAMDYVNVRERNGGPKWNLDFANFKELTLAVRDALNVNFSHFRAKGSYPDIRRVRCGCTKLVQELIRSGFGNAIQKAGGDGK